MTGTTTVVHPLAQRGSGEDHASHRHVDGEMRAWELRQRPACTAGQERAPHSGGQESAPRAGSPSGPLVVGATRVVGAARVVKSALGYGVVDVPHLLSHDPRQYPDVNPLLTAASPHGAVLGTESGPRASASASPAPAVGDSSGGASGGPPNPTSTPSTALVVVGIALLLAAATAGLVVRRRAATGGSAPGTPTLREAGG